MLVSCGRVWKYLCSRPYNLPNNWTLTVVHVTWKLITEDVALVWKLCLQYPHYVHNLFCSFLVYMHLTEYISHRIHIIIHISMVSCQKGPIRHAYAWQIEPFWQDILDMYKEKNVTKYRITPNEHSNGYWFTANKTVCDWRDALLQGVRYPFA